MAASVHLQPEGIDSGGGEGEADGTPWKSSKEGRNYKTEGGNEVWEARDATHLDRIL